MKLWQRALVFYFDWKGWTYPPDLFKGIDRAVVIGAPHTSNWDFVYVIAYFLKVGVRIRFAIKREWLRAPFKSMMESVGAIGINRSVSNHTTEDLAQLFAENEKLLLVVTPEGTRKRATRWRSGFYFVAKAAKVPIALGFVDYRNKTVGIGKLLMPSDDYEKDMREIMSFYRQFARMGRNPDQFALDERFI